MKIGLKQVKSWKVTPLGLSECGNDAPTYLCMDFLMSKDFIALERFVNTVSDAEKQMQHNQFIWPFAVLVTQNRWVTLWYLYIICIK